MAKITARGAREVARIAARNPGTGARYLYVITSDGRVLWRPAGPGEHYTVIGRRVPPARRNRELLVQLAERRGLAVTPPTWLHERNNDPAGTPARHPFWATVDAERVGQWLIFERGGTWYGYKITQNAWATFAGRGEAVAMAEGPQTDVWA